MPSEKARSAAIIFLLVLQQASVCSPATLMAPHRRRERLPMPRTKAQTQTTLAAMFNAAPQRGMCGLRNSQTHHRMCRQDPGIPALLNEARKLAVNNCEEQFQYDRWNCSIAYDNTYFFTRNRVYRETAVMHSIAAAALTHTVSRACAEGKLRSCGCGTDDLDTVIGSAAAYPGRPVWKWGPCEDNLKYGRRFTRRFLQLKHVGDDIVANTLRHNIEVGIRVTAHHYGEVCKCHGVSGSCTTKTCWNRLAPFSQTIAMLKTRYHDAQILTPNGASRRATSSQYRASANSPLVYLKPSPTFCNVTHGRRCRESDNCATLCCGRGYNTHVKNTTRHCNCRWNPDRISLQCDACRISQEVYSCK